MDPHAQPGIRANRIRAGYTVQIRQNDEPRNFWLTENMGDGWWKVVPSQHEWTEPKTAKLADDGTITEWNP